MELPLPCTQISTQFPTIGRRFTLDGRHLKQEQFELPLHTRSNGITQLGGSVIIARFVFTPKAEGSRYLVTCPPTSNVLVG